MRTAYTSDGHYHVRVFAAPVLTPQCQTPPAAPPSYCSSCGARMLLLEKAAQLCQLNRRVLYRWVEQGRLHFCEVADGSVLVCSRTLAAQVDGGDYATGRLPEAWATKHGFATNRLRIDR